MTSDVDRPRLHFTAQTGWINDPLGLTYHRGRYHLFFQYLPGGAAWGPEQHWGHATSDDLLHWAEGEVALAPGDGDYGVWSGSIAVPPVGPAALFYTTVDAPGDQIGRVRLAHPTDESWTSWTKKDVVAQLPDGVDATALRDPYVFHDGSTWRMLLGGGLADGTAAALSYRSGDLEAWTYDGLFASRHESETDPVRTGSMWECPQVFPLADRWVLSVSVWDPGEPQYQAYAVGDLVDGRFVAEAWGRLTYGPSYYAGSAFTDAHGARCLIYWLRGIADPAGVWTSAHSLPHTLRLDGTRVIAAPHDAVVAARTDGPPALREAGVELPRAVDLVWTLEHPDAVASLVVTDGDRVPLRLEAKEGKVVVSVGESRWDMPIGGADLRVVLDGPVAEVFTSGGVLAVPATGGAEVRTVTASGRGTVLGHPLR